MSLSIPRQIVQSGKLTVGEIGILGVLYALADDAGKVECPASEILAYTNVSRGTFYRYVKLLKEKNYITSWQPQNKGKYQNVIYQLTEV